MKIRNTYHRFISLSLAALVLLTSMSFSVDMHFCQDELQNFSLVGQAKVCHLVETKQTTEINSCPFHQKIQQNQTEKSQDETHEKGCQKNCCDNKTILIDFDVDLIQVITTEFSNILFTLPTLIQYVQNRIVHSIHLHQNYYPPLLNRDILIFLQSFLL